ncbi:MAG: TlpA family protein disulfide reductase, partial [Bacteroidota bacterium]
MANKKHRKKKQGPLLPVIVGLALVLVAAAMLAGTNSRSEVAGAQAPRDPSVLPVAVQFAAPDLTLENINGQAQSLADYRRQVILVNNWATWCPPCKAEMPVLEAYFETYAGQGFMIVAIEAGDAKDAVTEFALSNHLQFQVWLDPS